MNASSNGHDLERVDRFDELWEQQLNDTFVTQLTKVTLAPRVHTTRVYKYISNLYYYFIQ